MKPEAFLKKIGENIDSARKRKGLTKLALANSIEMDKSNLQKIILGKVNITAKTLLLLADALEIEPKELLK